MCPYPTHHFLSILTIVFPHLPLSFPFPSFSSLTRHFLPFSYRFLSLTHNFPPLPYHLLPANRNIFISYSLLSYPTPPFPSPSPLHCFHKLIFFFLPSCSSPVHYYFSLTHPFLSPTLLYPFPSPPYCFPKLLFVPLPSVHPLFTIFFPLTHHFLPLPPIKFSFLFRTALLSDRLTTPGF